MNTHNNHLAYWYNNNKECIWRTSDTDITSMSIGGCSRPTFSAKIEWRRIAQMIIVPVEKPDFEFVDTFKETSRGSGGFGHTGLS